MGKKTFVFSISVFLFLFPYSSMFPFKTKFYSKRTVDRMVTFIFSHSVFLMSQTSALLTSTFRFVHLPLRPSSPSPVVPLPPLNSWLPPRPPMVSGVVAVRLGSSSCRKTNTFESSPERLVRPFWQHNWIPQLCAR